MKLRIVLIIALFAGFIAAFNGRAAAQASNGQVRFLHAVPGAPAVDVFVDNILAVRKLDYANATRYLQIATGEHTVVVDATGTATKPSSAPLLTAKVNISEDKLNQLVVVAGTKDKPEAQVYPQELGPVAVGSARVTAVNALSDSSAIDIGRTETDAAQFIVGLKYGQVYGEFDLSATNFEVAVVPAGGEVANALIKPLTVGLDAGTHNTLVALGTVKGDVKPTFLLLTAATQANAATDVQLRFVNTVQTTKGLDVYVNGALAATALGFRDVTERIALPKGDGKIEVRNTGDLPTATALATATFNDGAQTVVIAGTPEKLAINTFKDVVAGIESPKASINLINLLDSPADFSVAGKLLVSKVDNASGGRSSELNQGFYKYELSVPDLKISVKGNLTVNGGTASDLIVAGTADAPVIVLATSGVNEKIGSAPTATTAPKATQPAAPTAVAAAPTATVAATQPPAADDATATPTPRPATTAGATGLVITNDGVNLKIREYPRTDAKTLGLIPSGQTVKILGIRGAASTKITPTNSAQKGTKFPTPTVAATGRADLWVFIEWQTEDGGTITGWTIAQYLDVTINGRLLRRDNLVDMLALPQIPEDRFGVIESNSVTPVAPDDKRTIGTVTTLPGTNAQLRRTPNFKGESLALVPSGGIVYILGKVDIPVKGEVGEPKSPIWFNVQFDVEGSTIIGWMSADFLVLTTKYNGKPVDVKDVPVITDIQPGSIRGNATQVLPSNKPAITAVVVNLQDGVNLQLRRNPDATSESLGLIPSGTEVEVLGRNGSGAWIEVRFGTLTGWANANFLKIVKSGRNFPIKDLKITNGDKDTFGTVTPTVTPIGAG